jgi:hypothetical protein
VDWRSSQETGTGDLVFQKNVAGTWTEKSHFIFLVYFVNIFTEYLLSS